MRIVAGSARGRSLATPRDEKIRPTSDRVRGAIFNVLGQWCDGLGVLDLFSGTGALGLEALSRGAARAVLVDKSRQGAALSKKNAEALGFEGQVEVRQEAAADAVGALAARGDRFDLVFLDPPYAQAAVVGLVQALAASGVLAEGARVVAEHGADEVVPEAVGALGRTFQRQFGDTVVSIFG